jgi:hypothetical protein
LPKGPPSLTVHWHAGCAHFVVSAIVPPRQVSQESSQLRLQRSISRNCDYAADRRTQKTSTFGAGGPIGRRFQQSTAVAAVVAMSKRSRPKIVVNGARLTRAIVIVRGQSVMLDADLADLYQVDTRTLNQAVQRNRARFPSDFMFQLTGRETDSLRSQTVILKRGRGRYRKYRPYAFTEHGVAMLSSVLRSSRAVQVNIEIIRAFIRLRHVGQWNGELAKRIDALESKCDRRFTAVFQAIRQLMAPPPIPRRPIGYLQLRT